jgi:DNA-binding transcriptional ArsR family regulator
MEDENHYDALMSQIKTIKDRIRGVVHRKANGLYLYGRPGTSKTFTVCTTLDTLGESYAHSNGHLTPMGLFDLIAENHSRTIVLDDVASIFSQPTALQLLLAALGNPHNRSGIRNVRYKTAKGDQVIPFTGGIVAVSNLPLAGHGHEVLAALSDRVYVIAFEPPDEQICALIERLAEHGVQDVPADKAKRVCRFLISECKRLGIRPSVRLFVDKAIPDFQLFAAGQTETHWRDLIRSNLQQQLVELEFPTNDLSRTEQIEAERRIALDVFLNFETLQERITAWKERTGKSQPAFYRRLKELKEAGRVPSREE